MTCSWTQSCAVADIMRGILSRGGLPGEALPVTGGAVVFLPVGIRAIEVAKLLAIFPGAEYDHVALTVSVNF